MCILGLGSLEPSTGQVLPLLLPLQTVISSVQNWTQMCLVLWRKEKCWCCQSHPPEASLPRFLPFFARGDILLQKEMHLSSFTTSVLPSCPWYLSMLCPVHLHHRDILWPELTRKIKTQRRHMRIQQIPWHGSFSVFLSKDITTQ